VIISPLALGNFYKYFFIVNLNYIYIIIIFVQYAGCFSVAPDLTWSEAW
jgi:hypothetical protein